MTIQTTLSMKALYDRDFVLWTETVIEQLKQVNFNDVDWENLIEEIASIGKSEKRALESLLTKILEHILKIEYWDLERERNIGHWSAEITNFRYQIAKIVQNSPSLKPYLVEVFPECYEVALRYVSRAMRVSINILPETPIASLEEILDDNWLPKNPDK
jgi:hypothetical protein